MRELQTKRLRLVPCRRQDVDELHDLFALPEVRRYLLDDQVMPRSWVESVVVDSDADFAEHGAGLWTLRGQNGELLGIAGYRNFFEPPMLQVIYALHPRAWGRGVATEALRALLEVGFDHCGFDDIVGATDEPNEASVRVMERAGMQRVDPSTFEPQLEEPGETIFLQIDRRTWSASGRRVLVGR